MKMKRESYAKCPFSVRLNDKEFEMIRILKEEYAINISGAFKIFLKKYLKVLQDNDKDIQI
jgi:hypothetical protein